MQVIYSHHKITDFIENLDIILIARIQNIVHMLEVLGNELRMPYSKSLGGGLFELRIVGSTHIRIIYTFHNNQAILLNIFIKKTWAIPKKEIKYAKDVLKLYLV